MAKSKAGFSMVEIIVSLGIFSILALVILGWQKDIFSINALFTKRLTSQEDIRKVIKNFIAETRTAQLSEAGSYPLETANKDTFTFYSDIDYDGIKEKVRYFLNNHQLKKGVIEPSGQPPVYNPDNETVVISAKNIINNNDEVFLYYDKDYDGDDSPLSQPVNILNVRLVQITLTVDEDPNRPPDPITETSQTSIRNLKDNL